MDQPREPLLSTPEVRDRPELLYDERKAKRHLRGWLSYAFASEVFVVVSLTMFLPICLEQFARDNGVLLPEKTEPCSSLNNNRPLRLRDETDNSRCVVRIGWAWIDSASFSLYCYSISVALQALTVISMGVVADHPTHRKNALLLFAALGSASAMLFVALSSSSLIWMTVSLLAILANVGFGASVVAMNAYLPSLAREDKDVVESLQKLRESNISDFTITETSDSQDQDQNLVEDSRDDTESLLPSQPTSPETRTLRDNYNSLLSETTSRISGTGIALGYFAGIVALILTIIPVMELKGSTFALRLAIAASGLWWALFTIPAWIWLPGGGFPHGDKSEATNSSRERGTWSIGREILTAWRRLGRTLRWQEIRRLTHTFRFLGAWFLLSDGFTTITSTALLFGKTSLHMSASALILVGVLVNAAGIFGALAWPCIQRYFKWSNKRVLITLVILCSLIPAYGCLGFLSLFRSKDEDVDFNTTARFGGLTTQEEMFGLAIYFGTVYGAFQAYARAFYAGLIPPGEEARWYALYSITDKSSSFVGPLAVGIIADATGNIRYAFFFLVAMIWSAIPFLISVNVEQGGADAQKYAQADLRSQNEH